MEQTKNDRAAGGAVGRTWVRWNRAMRQGFLDHLAATCNVVASAEAIGVHPSSVYKLRRRNAAFAEAWGEALVLGYEMLETHVVGRALAGAPGDVPTADANGAPCPIDVELALRLLNLHRHAPGKPRRGGPRPHIVTAEETDKVILAKLAKIEARRKAEAAEAAAEAAAAAGDPSHDGAEARA